MSAVVPPIGDGPRWLGLCQECGAAVRFLSEQSRNDAHDEKLQGPFCHRTEACVANGAQICACGDCLAAAVVDVERQEDGQ